MPEIHLHITDCNEVSVNNELCSFAAELNCELEVAYGMTRLMPEYMLRVHGVRLELQDYGWLLIREDEATSWEDYLFVKLAHHLASVFGGVLYYGDSAVPVVANTDKFETFDHYVDTVLERSEGMFKETKKHWLYTHQKRTLR